MKSTVGIVEFNGKPQTLLGEIVKKDMIAPNFKVVDQSLETVKLSDFDKKKRIISVMPSIDTPVCALQTRKFNEEASKHPETVILTISMDLPFALKRFCAAEGIANVITLSDYKYREFGYNYGFYVEELGLLARGVVVIDENNRIVHVEYCKDITQEPNYEAALKALTR